MNTQQPVTIVNKSPVSPVTALVGLAATVLAFFGIKKLASQHGENIAEGELDTEAGRIASQFKVLFDQSYVKDADFRKINVQVNSSNKDDVYKIYRKLTQRNLSDDMTRIDSNVVKATQKIEQYNSKPNGLFTIDASEKIKFEVGPGHLIRFAPGQTAPIWVYSNPLGVAIHNQGNKSLIEYYSKHKDPKEVAKSVRVAMSPTSKMYKVAGLHLVPVNGIKPREGWTKILIPFVNTSQTYAVIQIGANAYIDARDMIKHNALVGLTDIGSLLI